MLGVGLGLGLGLGRGCGGSGAPRSRASMSLPVMPSSSVIPISTPRALPAAAQASPWKG